MALDPPPWQASMTEEEKAERKKELEVAQKKAKERLTNGEIRTLGTPTPRRRPL